MMVSSFSLKSINSCTIVFSRSTSSTIAIPDFYKDRRMVYITSVQHTPIIYIIKSPAWNVLPMCWSVIEHHPTSCQHAECVYCTYYNMIKLKETVRIDDFGRTFWYTIFTYDVFLYGFSPVTDCCLCNMITNITCRAWNNSQTSDIFQPNVMSRYFVFGWT